MISDQGPTPSEDTKNEEFLVEQEEAIKNSLKTLEEEKDRIVDLEKEDEK